MKIGARIRARRENAAMSQEELARVVFVSRQTISNWENDRTYPDIRSIALMGQIFGVTLDELVLEDIPTMETIVDTGERERFDALSLAFTVAFVAVVVTPVPLVRYLSLAGAALWAVLAIVAMVLAVRVERFKKRNDMQTFREILAYTRGESLSALDRAREEGKRPYQKAGLALAAAVVAGGVSLALVSLLG